VLSSWGVTIDSNRDHFWDQAKIPVSPGSIFGFNQEACQLLEAFQDFLVAQLSRLPVLHADKTGIRIDKALHWLHYLSNDQWTFFFPHAKRGGEALKAMGVLDHFHGRLGHDHWKAYLQFNCTHFLCNAHDRRELECAAEQDGQKWAGSIKELLL